MAVREISVDDLAAALDNGGRLIDVRNPDEYAAGHIPGARSIPLPELAARLDELPTGCPVYLVCQSGNRSAAAVELLATTGIEAVSVAGGTSRWAAAGHPTTE